MRQMNVAFNRRKKVMPQASQEELTVIGARLSY